MFVLATAVSEELPAFFSVLSGVFLAGAGVADEPELSPALLLYPSEYHPPPFSWNTLSGDSLSCVEKFQKHGSRKNIHIRKLAFSVTLQSIK